MGHDHEGADEILLAGTDLAFVFRFENTDFPRLDGARTHVEAIMRAVAGCSRRRDELVDTGSTDPER